MAPWSSLALLLVANALLSIALVVFASGFFPYKPYKPGHASFDPEHEPDGPAPAPFDKLIFMVVDALRSDFVYSAESNFSFVQGLVRSGAALPFTAHASPPTVTMPKVKAMTTGSIPSFLDAILNFAESDTTSTLAEQDTWLFHLSHKPHGKLAMYGDDTWLKLFPHTFARADGTSSFFVSDFSEVDTNVTRHIPQELQNTDWNGLILHFLGLDHIGHKSGPQSVHMKPKQSEMDGIVKQIYKAMESSSHLQSTLFVLCGDHGMNDGGNHGGSSDGETSSALLFMSPSFRSISQGLPCPTLSDTQDYSYYAKIEQSDLAPSIAGLLGLPIPLNNLGVFVPSLLDLWEDDAQLRLVFQNARQLMTLLKDAFPHSGFDRTPTQVNCTDPRSEGEELACLWLDSLGLMASQNTPKSEKLVRLLDFCTKAQKTLSSAVSNYNTYRLITGIAFAAASLCLICLVYSFSFTGGYAMTSWLLTATIAYGLMMFASSFVEEEQQFWYWMMSAWSGWVFLKQQRLSVSDRLTSTLSALILVLSTSLLRKWNQTGQKHAGEQDIARNLMPSHNYTLWLLIITTYFDLMRRVAKGILPPAARIFAITAATILGFCSLTFKISFTIADAPELLSGFEPFLPSSITPSTLIIQARIVFVFTLLYVLLVWVLIFRMKYASSKEVSNQNVADGLHDLLAVILVSQSRTTNIPLFGLFQIQKTAFEAMNPSTEEIYFASLLFQYNAFFTFGGSNAMSSIDLSNAYNGVSGYNVIAVGFLTFFSNWAGPIWWASGLSLLTKRQDPHGDMSNLIRYWTILSFFSSFAILCVMLACTTLKTHLFIWTVFSPKYLYALAWYFGQHIGVNAGLGGCLYWLRSR